MKFVLVRIVKDFVSLRFGVEENNKIPWQLLLGEKNLSFVGTQF